MRCRLALVTTASVLILTGCASTPTGIQEETVSDLPAVVMPVAPPALKAEPMPPPPPPPPPVKKNGEPSGASDAGASTAPQPDTAATAETVTRGEKGIRYPTAALQMKLLGLKFAEGVGGRGMVAAKAGSAEFAADEARAKRRDDYLNSLKQGSYTFNTPSPIKVAKPVTIHFWLDPKMEYQRLGEELKAELQKAQPGGTPVTEAGTMGWSPRMKAALTGEDFEISPTEGNSFDGVKSLSGTARTTWSWDVEAKHPGEALPLHLKVYAVLPEDLGEPREVLKLDRSIRVDVTLLWVIDAYWERYWKWLLGGLGSALAAAIAWWWKNRYGAPAAKTGGAAGP